MLYVLAAAIGVVMVWLMAGNVIFEDFFEWFRQIFRYVSIHLR
jgi:hypothetical protein